MPSSILSADYFRVRELAVHIWLKSCIDQISETDSVLGPESIYVFSVSEIRGDYGWMCSLLQRVLSVRA